MGYVNQCCSATRGAAHSEKTLLPQQNSCLHALFFFYEHDETFLEKQWLHLYFHWSCCPGLCEGKHSVEATKSRANRTFRPPQTSCWCQQRGREDNYSTEFGDNKMSSICSSKTYFLTWFLGMAHEQENSLWCISLIKNKHKKSNWEALAAGLCRLLNRF